MISGYSLGSPKELLRIRGVVRILRPVAEVVVDGFDYQELIICISCYFQHLLQSC